MFNFSVIDSNNPKWGILLKKSNIYDFYHTSFYHNIDNNFTSLLFIAECSNDFIALPLVLRPIEQTVWFDLTSVYGYCGPFSSRVKFDFDQNFIDYFQINLKDYCIKNNIVSLFSRLHPLMIQKPLFTKMGEVSPINKTVLIDLRLSMDDQKRQYRKSLKSELNQLRRKGFYIQEAHSDEDIEAFIEIYYKTMDRVRASRNYYFSKDYFLFFLRNNNFLTKLLLAKLDGKIVAGGIFTITNKVMQYHLAGTTEEFIKDAPMKLIIEEARLLANNLSLDYFHLGGGVGGSEVDSLFKFKSGFSNIYCQYSVWKFIFNEEVYFNLSKNKVKSSFFPLYRS